MRDRFALPLIALIAAAMVAAALVWPQGQGTRSAAPFGHAMAGQEKTITVKGHTLHPAKAAQDAAEDALQGVQ